MSLLDPISDFDAGARDSHGGIMSVLRSTFVLRFGAGMVLFLEYGLEGTLRAWHAVWDHAPWPLVDTAAKTGVPWPTVLVPLAALTAGAVSLAWMLGFLTRFFSLLALPLLLGAGIVLSRLNLDTQMTVCVLLGLIAVTLLMSGSGALSVDRLFQMMARPKKKKTKF